jgi:phosphoribosylformylglycinamidine cyclo-ligase
MTKFSSYKDAGVDIDKANLFVESIKPLVKSTSRKEVMAGLGGFGGLFHLDTGKIKNPVLVSSTDGVGTKLKIAQMTNRHDTIGIDLVAMCANDVVVQGAEPLFFLDYISVGKLDVKKEIQIVSGIVKGCQEAGCALIGGETAEMPGLYRDEEYDLAGFCVGVVEAERLIDGSEIRVGDRIIGIASSGIHSNGFSLARKVLFEDAGIKIEDHPDGLVQSIGDELIKPTKIYVKSILNLLKKFSLKGIVHITGGGFYDNIPRIIPAPCRAVIFEGSWEIPHVFDIIQKIGHVRHDEMFRVFNMGIGMIIVVPEKEAADILEHLNILGEQAYAVGIIDKKDIDQPSVLFV